MKRPHLFQRATERFAADPASVKNAALVMIVITVGIVFVGGVIVWMFDRQDFTDLGSALWYTLQTVTTVGYGGHVPTTEIGRFVAAADLAEDSRDVGVRGHAAGGCQGRAGGAGGAVRERGGGGGWLLSRTPVRQA